jgi:hypothetical protein
VIRDQGAGSPVAERPDLPMSGCPILGIFL